MSPQMLRLIAALAALALLSACAPEPTPEPGGPALTVTRVDVISAPTPTPRPAQPVAASDGTIPTVEYYFGHTDFEGQDLDLYMPFYMFQPQDLGTEPERLYPLIIVLHGAGPSAENILTLDPPALPAPLRENPEEYAAFRISPLAPLGKSWAQIPDAVAGLAEYMIETYPVDPERVYLMGFSMGGGGVFGIASTYPEPFAAFVPIAGYWPYQGGDIRRDPDTLCNGADRAFYIVHGDRDDEVLWQLSEDMQIKLERVCEAENVVFDLRPGVDHMTAGREGISDPAVYEWLFQQRRPQ